MSHGLDYGSWATQPVQSLPRLFQCPDSDPCDRCFDFSTDRRILGGAAGDRLGYASSGGDFNLDGNQDILCGAPGADRNGAVDAGIVYVIFGRLDFGDMFLGTEQIEFDEDILGYWFYGRMPIMNPPRVEIRGTRSGDRFGGMQTIVGDVNQDGLPDIGFASPYAGGDGPGGVESGFIGIVFGGRQLTGENFLTVDQVGTAQLPGVRIYGTQAGGRSFAKSITGYSWQGGSKDVPKKDGINDHACDALRYWAINTRWEGSEVVRQAKGAFRQAEKQAPRVAFKPGDLR